MPLKWPLSPLGMIPMKRMIFLVASLAWVAAAHASSDRIVDAVHSLDPSAAIDSQSPGPIHGLTTVSVNGQTLFVSADGRYVIQGELYDLKHHDDISDDLRSAHRARALSTVPAAYRIIFKAAHEQHRVIIFFDPDCAYCRAMLGHVHDYQAAGITLEVLAYPQAGLNSSAFKRAEAIWCSRNRHRALIASLTGSVPGSGAACALVITSEMNLALDLQVPGTPTLLDTKGHYLGGYLTASALANRLLHVEDVSQ